MSIKVRVQVDRLSEGFGSSMIPYDDNNPRKSWENCISKHAIQLHENKLWKCPALAYLPMQSKKYNLSDKWEPYLKYTPIDVNSTDDELEEFEEFINDLYSNEKQPQQIFLDFSLKFEKFLFAFF